MSIFSIDETHDPQRQSWVESANGHSEFPIQNLPFGIAARAGQQPRPAVAIGDHVLDLAAIADLLPPQTHDALQAGDLNALFALDEAVRRALRQALSRLLSDPAHRARIEPALCPMADCTLHLPFTIGDYTDFYVGIHHATNVGKLFRPDNPLLPNYKHVPIGYHGRASSIRPSDVDVLRPRGQRKLPDAPGPIFGPTARLDYELELGVWIGQGNALGQPIPIGEAAAHIAGFCLLNDWSARDFQAWEYQPLGPFLAKNFHSTISPWVVTAEALAPFRIAQPPRPEGDPAPLPYLWDDKDQSAGQFSLALEVAIRTRTMREEGTPAAALSASNASDMYWTVAQLVAHHSSNGCDLRTGDLLGSGTISGATRDAFGSLLELTQGGAEPITLPNGEKRSFVEDGDEIILTAHAHRDGFASIGFGQNRATILPAIA
ncbi:fumarylacetoacetase [Novosphingobium terrae]|uniref:fumarylacetoacetase n=1 Tax=Novosphingobium terrae TaxID=2726189 RepID=UPI00197D483F|nr:fumarylacetoacetase [Novosphingobium terrae]